MKINHIGLYVSDIEAAKNFFVTYFGATTNEMYRNEKKDFCSYFLTFSDSSRIEIMTRTGIEGNRSLGDCHISFSVGGRSEVDALTKRLRADGYEVMDGPRTTGDGCYESCVMGIDGNLIEITE